jgi:hypothetical protein
MVLQSPKGVVENFFKRFFPWMMDMYGDYQQKGGLSGMSGFQNPWMKNNPFQFKNPFMPASAQQKPDKKSKKAAPQQEPEEPPVSKGKSEDDKMAEILERLRELEDKIQSES